MTLEELEKTLVRHPDKTFALLLPNGSPVPASFHVTEVGRVQKTFLDCGGKLHHTEVCQLQVWLGGDEDHRITAGKLAGILRKARAILPDAGIPVEIEYGNDAAAQYPVKDFRMDAMGMVFQLGSKRTDCPAKKECGPSGHGEEASTACCGSGCGCN